MTETILDLTIVQRIHPRYPVLVSLVAASFAKKERCPCCIDNVSSRSSVSHGARE